MLVTGTMPYGTYFDAGYVGFPSFGGVSIERGHFGKFLTPALPRSSCIGPSKDRRMKSFPCSFEVVTLVNFSASSLSFFAVYVALTVVAFRARMLNLKFAAVVTTIAGAVSVFIIYTWRLWAAVAEKVYDSWRSKVEPAAGGTSVHSWITSRHIH